jgi:hypothetical protein
VGELKNAAKGYQMLAALNPAYLIAVIAALFRKLLLGEMPVNPQLPDLLAEQNQCAGHAASLVRVTVTYFL